jgi:hypothetical protein
MSMCPSCISSWSDPSSCPSLLAFLLFWFFFFTISSRLRSCFRARGSGDSARVRGGDQAQADRGAQAQVRRGAGWRRAAQAAGAYQASARARCCRRAGAAPRRAPGGGGRCPVARVRALARDGCGESSEARGARGRARLVRGQRMACAPGPGWANR